MKRTGPFTLTAILTLVSIAALIWTDTGVLAARTSTSIVTRSEQQDEPKDISPEALKQIEALEAEKDSRTPAQTKIDSRLLYEVKMARGQAIADGVPNLDTGLKVENGYIDVDISAQVNKTLLRELRLRGGEIIVFFPEYHSITARIPIAEVETLAARDDVNFIQPKLEAMINRSGNSSYESRVYGRSLPAARTFNAIKLAVDPGFSSRASRVRQFLANTLGSDQLTGSVTTEGDTTHRASLARTIAGVNGTGLKIGVLSDGVNSLATSKASGNLPAGVTVLAGQAGSGDEGTAMLELVYDVAPGAQLYFATAFTSITSFAQNIKDLRTAGCDIIIDDVSYFNETPFQNGQIAPVVSPGNAGVVVQAVNDVTIGSQAGAMYFSSAANSGNKDDNTSGAWEGDFVDGGATSPPLPAGSFLNFGGGATTNPLLTGGRVVLKWSDPLGGSSNDYDLFVLNATGGGIGSSSTNIQNGTQDPYEDVGNIAAGKRVVIVKKSAAAARFIHLNTNGGVLTTSTSGVIFGHNGGVNTISVAATPAGPAQNNLAFGPFPNAYSSSNTVETFSSDGPRRIFYNANSSLITPGNVSSTGGQLLQKPDITAADGTSTSLGAATGFNPFFGTSAAAPHAGALMALLKQASPASNNTQLYNAMVSSALDIESPGFDRDSGAGIFMPLRAMNALSVAGPAILEMGTITSSEFFGNGNGRLEPGESADLTIPLNNLGLTNATAISATLTTSTPGVSLLNAFSPQSLTYPDLAAAVGSATSFSPFRFGLDQSGFTCGTTINFTLTVNYTGGSSGSQVFNFSIATSPAVSTTLDTTAPPAGGGYTATTGTQTGRLVRNGTASTCAVPKASPGQNDTTPGRRFDAYTFKASASGCATITLNGSINLFAAAYNNAGFVPSNTTTNYLADAGTSGGSTTFSFNVVAGQNYTVVVHEVNVGEGLGTNYTLNIAAPVACFLAPTAAPAQVAGRVADSDGRAVGGAVVTLNGQSGIEYSARTNNFGYFVIDGVPTAEGYMASVRAKGLTFTPQFVQILDNIDSLTFVANP